MKNFHFKNPIQINKIASLLVLFLVLPVLMFGQVGVETTLTNLQTWIVNIVKIVFVIAITIGIIRVVIQFLSGSPNAVRNLVFLVVAVLLYLGFSTLISDFEGFTDGIDIITP